MANATIEVRPSGARRVPRRPDESADVGRDGWWLAGARGSRSARRPEEWGRRLRDEDREGLSEAGYGSWPRCRPEDDSEQSPIPYPGGCPQPWTEVDTGEALVEGRSCRYAVGDRGRLVEKLSPGMCTGWGDLVVAGSRQVTDRPIRTHAQRVDESAHEALDTALTCVYSGDAAATPTAGPRRGGQPPVRTGNDLGIEQGHTGDSTWTTTGRGAQPSRCPRVDTGDAVTTHSRPTGPFAA